MENYLVSALFKAKTSNKDANSTLATPNSNLKEFCFDRILPTNCRKQKRLRIMEKARYTLEKEVDIIKMIQSRRYLHLALKNLLDL